MSLTDAALLAGSIAAIVLLRSGFWHAYRHVARMQCDLPESRRRAFSQTVCWVAVIGFPLGFTAIASQIDTDWLVATDTAIIEFVEPYHHDAFIAIFAWITELADTATLTAVAVITTGVIWANGPGGVLVPVWLVILGSQGTTWIAKLVFDRARPEFAFDVTAASPSFPSAHASGSVAVYGILAYVIARGLATRRARFEVAYWAVVAIVLISFSRIYVTVHHPTDVIAGLLVGGFWLVIGILGFERLRHVRPALRKG